MSEQYLDNLIEAYPELLVCKEQIRQAYVALRETYEKGGKLLVAGNGGSASDAEHVVGELMKSFVCPRRATKEQMQCLEAVDKERGAYLAKQLEQALPAISLVSQSSISTAYINDVGAACVYAQQVFGYGKEEDAFLGISTSGDSENIIYAAVAAKAKGLKTIGLTGASGGKMKQYMDVCICVPREHTHRIQELHLPIYHCLCMMVENYFFGDAYEG